MCVCVCVCIYIRVCVAIIYIYIPTLRRTLPLTLPFWFQVTLTLEGERFNVWAALLNLEKKFGDADSLALLFKRAVAQASPLKVFLHMASAHERAGEGYPLTLTP